MPLYLTEEDIEGLLGMPEVVQAVEAAFRRQAAGQVTNQPRRRLYMPHGTFHSMAAADLGLGTFSTKIYSSFRPKTRFLTLLFSTESGDLLAVIEADRLGQLRTGAATGVAVKLLTHQSTSEPLRVGIFGTGWQAESQLEAVSAVCNAEITAYSRNAEKCAEFCERMSQELAQSVTPAATPQAAVTGRQVVITATSSKDPVFDGEWLSPGALVCAMGGNLLMKREIDDVTVQRSQLVVVDSIEQAKLEAGDLLPAIERRILRWETVVELCSIVSGDHKRQNDEQIVLFKSIGVALEDTAVATLAYQKATGAGVGRQVEMWQGA